MKKETFCAFFEGKAYPCLTAAAVLLGYGTKTEIYVFVLLMALLFCSFFYTEGTLHTVVPLCSALFLIPVEHSPSYPYNSDYLFSGVPLLLLILGFLLLLGGLVVFWIRQKPYRRFHESVRPFLISLFLFCFSLLLGGVFSPAYTGREALLALLLSVGYLLPFFLYYLGIRKKDMERLKERLPFDSALLAMIIVIQLGMLYLSGRVFGEGGVILKEQILLGWGIWTSVGASLVVLIPLQMYGFLRGGRGSFLYLVTGVLTTAGAVLSMSRNALLFGGVFFFACMLSCCFIGENKRLARGSVIGGVLLLGLICLLRWEQLHLLFADFFERGFSDNGRYEIWGGFFAAFREHPLLGGGFYALCPEGWANLYPRFAHNTLIQLLGSTGLLGLGAYLAYRGLSLYPALKKRNAFSLCLVLSVAALLCLSMLDIFMFSLQFMLYYNLALAVLYRQAEPEESV